MRHERAHAVNHSLFKENMYDQFVIENKVAKSGLITIDLEKLATDVEFHSFDIKDFLYMELLLKEKDFREALEKHNWAQYKGGVLGVHCSSDAIIASWAFMLIVSYAKPLVVAVHSGTLEEAREKWFMDQIREHNWTQYAGKRVLLKGCSDKSIPQSAYAYATECLVPHAERIMYGEACSFVPVWRRSK